MRIFLLFLILASLPGLALAGKSPLPGTACESDYWNILGARAWMEGKHDMEAAQVLIETGPNFTRPVSILDMVEFDCRLIELGNAANNMFSDNLKPPLFYNASFFPFDAFEPTIVNHSYNSVGGAHPSIGYSYLNPRRLDRALERLIRNGLVDYFYPNFLILRPRPPSRQCGGMSGLWTAAKCTDFSKGTFWTFAGITCGDPRGCEIPCPRPSWLPKYNLAIINSWPKTSGSVMHSGTNPSGVTGVPVTSGPFPVMDAAVTYLDLLDPTKCATTVLAIPTGVKVQQTTCVDPPDCTKFTNTIHADAVCTAPSCWYDPTAGKCKP